MASYPKYHLCTTASRSGIARYAEDFYNVILQKNGFVQISPENLNSEWLATLPKETVFHVELGNNQYAERDALICLLENGFVNVDATVHDAPWVTFPFYRFENRLLNQLSKAFDWYLGGAGATGRLLRGCRRVYVLTQMGKTLLEERHNLKNVSYMPHVIDPDKIWSDPVNSDCRDIVFFGFIGANKGLEYALAVHSEIRRQSPDVRMYVVGEAFNQKAQYYFDKLKEEYSDGVSYLGFVPEPDMDAVFCKASHVFLPFLPFKFWCPCSGSVLHALRRGRILWTNPVNAVPETVRDGVNGRYLSGDARKDANEFIAMIGNSPELARLSLAAIQTCHTMQDDLKLKFPGDRYSR
jgi:glycosyltransferase involved in cell wall biosynthesis